MVDRHRMYGYIILRDHQYGIMSRNTPGGLPRSRNNAFCV
jgi:hypothetical protein